LRYVVILENNRQGIGTVLQTQVKQRKQIMSLFVDKKINLVIADGREH